MTVFDAQILRLPVDQYDGADLAPVNTDEAIDDEVKNLFVLVGRSKNIEDFRQVGESLLLESDVLHILLLSCDPLRGERVTNDAWLKDLVGSSTRRPDITSLQPEVC